MTLQIVPLTMDELTAMENDTNIYEPGDDLVGPPIPICWPVRTSAEAQTRLRVHMAKQSERLQKDPSVHYLKVVNDSHSIVSIARWHFYPNGYSYAREGHWEQYPPAALSEPWARGFNIPLNNFILGSRDAERECWMPRGRPCWVLMHMVTRLSQRGKGAARLLVQWGIDRAERMGFPAYLEAGVMGMPIYEKMGFRRVGELMELDLRAFGVEGMFGMAKMVYVPHSKGEGS